MVTLKDAPVYTWRHCAELFTSVNRSPAPIPHRFAARPVIGYGACMRRPGYLMKLITAVALVGATALSACGGPPPTRAAEWVPPTSATTKAPSGSAGPAASPSASRGPSTYVFPVQGKASYARTHHDYPASDIIANCGLDYLAVTSGTVVQVNRVDSYDKNVHAGITRGGLSLSIVGDDGVRYYGSHFTTIDTEINPGVRVTTGQVLAKVGRTGDAGACHVHFGISPPCAQADDWWIRRGVIWPWSYLDSWKAGAGKAPLTEITAWEKANGCPGQAPPGA
jgi:peptidoglycan LD-endopeptidase LytH